MQELMHLARNKFTLLTGSGRWSAPSQEEEKIITSKGRPRSHLAAEAAVVVEGEKGAAGEEG